MKWNCASHLAASLACLVMVFSPVAALAEDAQPSRDIVLQQGNVLSGQVIDSEGSIQSMTLVTVENHEAEVARVRTDDQGRFSVTGLPGGVYKVASRGQESVYRMWAPNTAPPVAQQGLTMVVGKDVVRGQYGYAPGPFTSIGQWCADHPLMCAAAVGAAIAIPIAVAADDDDGPSTP